MNEINNNETQNNRTYIDSKFRGHTVYCIRQSFNFYTFLLSSLAAEIFLYKKKKNPRKGTKQKQTAFQKKMKKQKKWRVVSTLGRFLGRWGLCFTAVFSDRLWCKWVAVSEVPEVLPGSAWGLVLTSSCCTGNKVSLMNFAGGCYSRPFTSTFFRAAERTAEVNAALAAFCVTAGAQRPLQPHPCAAQQYSDPLCWD